MKTFSKMWWVFGIIDATAAYFNPYVGLFGSINIAALVVMGIFSLIIYIIYKFNSIEEYSENKILVVASKIINSLSCIFSVVFCVAKIFAAIFAFMLTYHKNMVVSRYQIWSNPGLAGIILLIVDIIFSILFLASFISPILIKKLSMNKGKGKYKNLNIACIIAMLISLIVGFIYPDERFLTFIFNLWYLLVIFIYFVILISAKKVINNSFLKVGENSYLRDYYKRISGNRRKIFNIASLFIINILITVSKLLLFPISSPIMFGLSILAEIAVVITFSIRIWKENGQGDDIKYAIRDVEK